VATTIATASPTWLTVSLASAWLVLGACRDGADQQRQRLRDPAVEVVIGVDGDQTLNRQGVGDVDVDDAGVRVRAAQERGGQRVVAEVVQVPAVAGGQAQVLLPQDRRAERTGGLALVVRRFLLDRASGCGRDCHDAPSCVDECSSSAARSTDLTMFWYPVQRHRLPPIASRASSASGRDCAPGMRSPS
jgi:hypothetical protein